MHDQRQERFAAQLREVVGGDEKLRAGLTAQLGEAARNAIFRPLGAPRFPLALAEFDKTLIVEQGTYGVGSVTKPILVTQGIGNSVGLLIHEPESRLGFLSHSDSMSFLYSCVDGDGSHVLGCKWGNPRHSAHVRALFGALSGAAERRFDLQVTVIRGPETTDESVAKITDSLNYRRPSNVKLSSSSLISVPDGSIGIDIRSGLIVSFNPSFDQPKRANSSHPFLNSFRDWALAGL